VLVPVGEAEPERAVQAALERVAPRSPPSYTGMNC
jgi:hypothetical protein